MGKRTPCACRLCVRVRMRAQLWAGEQGSARRDYLGISTTGPPTHTHTRTHTYADAHPRTPSHTCTYRYACAVGDGRAVDVGATSAERQSCRRPPAPTPPSHTSKCPPRHTHTHATADHTHAEACTHSRPQSHPTYTPTRARTCECVASWLRQHALVGTGARARSHPVECAAPCRTAVRQQCRGTATRGLWAACARVQRHSG